MKIKISIPKAKFRVGKNKLSGTNTSFRILK